MGEPQRKPVGRTCKKRGFRCTLKNALLSGLLVTVPVVLTCWVVAFLFRTFENLLKPLAGRFLTVYVPGFGILLTALLLLLVGIQANNYVAQWLIRTGEKVVKRIPLAGGVYEAIKRVMEGLAGGDEETPKKVVLVPYPVDGRWAIGFLNGEVVLTGGQRAGLVLVLGALNPTTGVLAVIPMEKILALDIPVDSAMAIVISCGLVSPGSFPVSPLGGNPPIREIGVD